MNFYTQILPGEIPYYGQELRPHWIAERTQRFGSSLVAFVGPCSVPTESLVDLEDRFVGDSIRARSMLHFLGEFFEDSLALTITRQRLLVALFGERLNRRLALMQAGLVEREGDDLFAFRDGRKQKLSVSIVTASPVSTLLHFGVNIDATGAPVDAIGLQNLGIPPLEVAAEVLSAWAEEMQGESLARAKVLPR